jgi:hypothetical protein
MEDRVKLKVLGISYNQLQSGAFALLLAEEDGPHRIPVVIGPAEAQAIAIRLEHIVTPRPLTHDLFVSFAQAFGVRLTGVFIYKFNDGIFSSELTFSDGERQVVIDARTSDAIAIAMRCNAPITTTRAIVEETGFIIENEHSLSDDEFDEDIAAEPESESDIDEPQEHSMSVEELEAMLARLIEEENYEEASRISQLIKKKKNL